MQGSREIYDKYTYYTIAREHSLFYWLRFSNVKLRYTKSFIYFHMISMGIAPRVGKVVAEPNKKTETKKYTTQKFLCGDYYSLELMQWDSQESQA